MSPKCKVSFFFFLFKLFTKSSWKSERQLPLQGLKSIKTTTEQLKQSEREKGKGNNVQNVWHLVLSTGFPRAPLGIESKIYWQTRILNTQEGEPQRLLPTEAALCSQTVGCTAVSLRLGFLASFHPITPSRKLSSLPSTGPPFGRPFLLVRVASSIILGNLRVPEQKFCQDPFLHQPLYG